MKWEGTRCFSVEDQASELGHFELRVVVLATRPAVYSTALGVNRDTTFPSSCVRLARSKNAIVFYLEAGSVFYLACLNGLSGWNGEYFFHLLEHSRGHCLDCLWLSGILVADGLLLFGRTHNFWIQCYESFLFGFKHISKFLPLFRAHTRGAPLPCVLGCFLRNFGQGCTWWEYCMFAFGLEVYNFFAVRSYGSCFTAVHPFQVRNVQMVPATWSTGARSQFQEREFHKQRLNKGPVLIVIEVNHTDF